MSIPLSERLQTKKLTFFSVFSGVGGFELGLDGECVGLSEIDKWASMVLKYRFPNVKNYGDITKIKWEQIPDFDLLVGGSPCQNFSIAGKRAGIAGSQSRLVWEFIRGLRQKQPRNFIWENVRGAMSSRGGWDFANIISAFSESGYSLWWQVLNAKDFGVPQNRERIFVIGTRGSSPKEIFFERQDSQTHNVIPTLTGRYYGGQANGAYIRNKPQQIIGGSQAYRVYGTDGTSTALASQAGGLGAKTGLYAVDPTLRAEAHQTADVHYIPEGNQIRRLTPTEAERLMSWPDSWTKWGINEKGETVEISDAQRYRQCGNGVVSAVVKELQQILCLNPQNSQKK